MSVEKLGMGAYAQSDRVDPTIQLWKFNKSVIDSSREWFTATCKWSL